MLNASNFQWRSTDPYRALDRGTGAWGVKDVAPTVPEVVVATEDFETDPISGSGTWTISLITPHTGLRCLRSAVIGGNQNTDYTFTIPVTATAVRFWWRVSSELNFDFFRVYKDAIIPGNLLMQASGITDVYAQATLDVTGATTVTFRYIKDASASGGLDRAIIDDIEWIIPEVPGIFLYEPLHLEPVENRLKVDVGADIDIRPLLCATDSVTTCPESSTLPTLSTTTPLGAGASFTSPWVQVDQFADLRIGSLADVNGTLFTEHSNDNGVTIIRSSSQPTIASRAEFLSFHPRANFLRVRYVNGPIAQTSFQLFVNAFSVAYGETQSLFSAPLGRTSLATQTRAAIYDFEYDEFANVAPQIKDLHVVQRTSLIADNFRQTAGLDLQTWQNAITGSGTTAIDNGRLRLRTGVVANSTARTESIRRGRFISGSHQLFRAGVGLPSNGTTDCKRRWGVYDDVSGYFFELDGTILYAVSRRAGVDTKVPASAWSFINTFSIPVGGGNFRFEIAYFGNTAYFAINGDNHHLMSGTVGGLPRTNGTNFPNRFEIINENGSVTDTDLFITGTSQQRYGPDQISPRFTRIAGPASTLIKGDAGRLHRVVIANGSGSNTCTIYDNIIAAAPIVAVLNVNKLSGNVEFNTDMSNGITVVTTGADTDVTVVFD